MFYKDVSKIFYDSQRYKNYTIDPLIIFCSILFFFIQNQQLYKHNVHSMCVTMFYCSAIIISVPNK